MDVGLGVQEVTGALGGGVGRRQHVEERGGGRRDGKCSQSHQQLS